VPVRAGKPGEPQPEVFNIILIPPKFPKDEEACWVRCLSRHTGIFNTDAKIQE